MVVSTKHFLNILIFLFVSHSIMANIEVESFRKNDKMGDHEVIQKALDALASQGHGKLIFDGSKTYQIEQCLELPRHTKGGRKNFILEGNGAVMQAKHDSIKIFNRLPKNQNEALNKMMNVRFVIQDFTFIGGAKGINIGATFGTTVLRCNFHNQNEAAIDIQFGLQTRIEHCYATNCIKDNFILRTGEDWGGSANNSQSNHSVIESCRVYARKGSSTGYKILGSGGCVLNNIISEGNKEMDYAVYADRLGSTTVRYFKINNFHLEHAPIKAGIYVRMTGNVEIDGIFYQLSRKEFSLIHAGSQSGLINVKNIPHYVSGTVLRQEQSGGGAVWNVMYCSKQFYDPNNWRIKNKKTGEYDTKLPYYFSGQGGSYQIKKKY